VAPKSKPLPSYQKSYRILLKPDKLKYQPNTILLYVGIKYSVRDLLVTSLTIPDLQSSDMHHIGPIYTVNDVSDPFGISLP